MTVTSHCQPPKTRSLCLLALFLIIAALAFPCLSEETINYQGTSYDPDEFRVSYAYAAVMGTGTYKIDGRQITMLRLPFQLTQRRADEGEFGIKWYLPVSIGYDAVTDNNWLDLIFDEDLVTLTVMPGVRAHLPLNDTWSIKPFGKAGATWDFTLDDTILLAQIGITSLGTWVRDDGWEIRWGGGFQVVGEYQIDATTSNGFSVLETGVDLRRDTGFQFLKSKVNAGVYYRYQHFFPVWDLAESPIEDSDVSYIHELGVSVGLKKSRKFLGITLTRVRLGFQYGEAFKGWTMGGEFPF